MKRIKCSAWLVVLFVFAAALTSTARAATVTVTINGHVHDGTDTTGVFVSAGYSFTSHPNLKPFTLTFTFDDSQGRQTISYCAGTVGFSSIINVGTSNPGTATLTIDGTSFPLGGGTMGQSSISSHFELWQYGCTYSRAGVGVNVNYTTGGYSGSSYVGSYNPGQLIGPASPYSSTSLNPNFDWRAAIISPGVPLASTWYIPFDVAIYQDTGGGYNTWAWASGNLSPEYMIISGVSCSSKTISLSLDSSATGQHPNIVQPYETTPIAVSISPGAAIPLSLSTNNGGTAYGSIPGGVTTDSSGNATVTYVGLAPSGGVYAGDDTITGFFCGATSNTVDVYDYYVSGFNIHQSQVSDTAFTNSSDLSQAQIESFLTNEGTFLFEFYVVDTANDGTYQDGFYDTNANGQYDSGEPVYCHSGGTSCLPTSGTFPPKMRADAAISGAATFYGINPKLLLAKLQVETQLITAYSLPSYTALNWAMGCDASPGSWFFDQVDCSAQAFKDNYTAATAKGEPYFFPVDTNPAHYTWNVKLSFSSTCGNSTLVTGCALVGFTMNNSATVALYNYTPFVQDQTTGGGVRLFESVWHGYDAIGWY